MKKITILMLHFKPGGIEVQTSRFANELAKKYEVEIISVYNIDNVRALPLDERIKITYLLNCGPNRQEFKDALKSKNIIKAIKECIKGVRRLYLKKHLMIKMIKNLNTDIVFSSRIEFAELLSKYCSDKIIKITQEHQHNDTRKYKKYAKKAFKNIDYLALLSEESAKYYKKWIEGNTKTKIIIIPNIIEKVDKETAKLDNNDLIVIARLDMIKRLDLMFNVINKVKETIPDIKLKVVGAGEDKERLINYVKEINLENNIEFKGNLPNKEALNELIKSSLFLMTSKNECLPMVLLEAFSSGVPVIAFDVPVGPKAIITDKENGILIENNNIEKMAEEIIKLLNNRNELKRLGKNAKVNSYKYLAENIMPKWYELFDKVGKNER